MWARSLSGGGDGGLDGDLPLRDVPEGSRDGVRNDLAGREERVPMGERGEVRHSLRVVVGQAPLVLQPVRFPADQHARRK